MLKVGDRNVEESSTANNLGYIKESWNAPDITPEMQTVTITKVTDNPTWGALYLQYSDRLSNVQKTKGNILNIEKQLFITRSVNNRQELIPVNTGNVHIGDKLIVRLVINLTRDMEYVCLKDFRAACFQPVQQLSGIRWQSGTMYYEDTKDATTNFFFDRLGKGTYVIEYPVWINQDGLFQNGIATLQCLYAPEFISHSTTTEIKVTP